MPALGGICHRLAQFVVLHCDYERFGALVSCKLAVVEAKDLLQINNPSL